MDNSSKLTDLIKLRQKRTKTQPRKAIAVKNDITYKFKVESLSTNRLTVYKVTCLEKSDHIQIQTGTMVCVSDDCETSQTFATVDGFLKLH